MTVFKLDFMDILHQDLDELMSTEKLRGYSHRGEWPFWVIVCIGGETSVNALMEAKKANISGQIPPIFSK